MSATTVAPVSPVHRPTAGPSRRLAWQIGLLYLTLAVLGMFAVLVMENLVVPGDPAATVQEIDAATVLFGASLVAWLAIVLVDAALAVMLYRLLAPAGRLHASVAAALRLLYAAVVGALLVLPYDVHRLLTDPDRAAGRSGRELQLMVWDRMTTFGTGFDLALVVFGSHLLALGSLLYRSRYVPRAFGVLLVAAGVGYVVDSTTALLGSGLPVVASGVLLTPAVVGEIGLAVWLVVRRVSAPSAPAGG